MHLSEQDQLKLARAAEYIDRTQEESDRANQDLERLRHADDEALLAILGDPSSLAMARRNALVIALGRSHLRNGTLTQLIPPLLEDPDDDLAAMAIQYAPLVDPASAERLHALLDDPRLVRWSQAASALARRGDETIIGRLTGWFREGDREHRNVAYACLCLNPLLGQDECLALLREAWEAGGRDDDDRVMLAVGLLGVGDRAGWAFLVDHCRKADRYSAGWAAETIKRHDPAQGLALMRHILDHGTTFRVRWGMVEKIAHAADLHHLWTADGLAEARFWVEQHMSELERPHHETG